MTEPFEAVPRNEIQPGLWDGFCDSSDQAWLWHRYAFQTVLCTWPGRKDASFAVRESSGQRRLLALVPLHRIERRLGGLLPISLLDSLGGPALSNDVANKTRERILDFIVRHLAKMADRRCVQVRLALSPMAPAWRQADAPRVNPLLSLGCRDNSGQTWVVDLRPGIAALWQGLEGRTRTAVRKAEKAGVTIRLADRPGDLNHYYRLHQQTYLRTRAQPHPKAYFESIWNHMMSAGLARIYVAELNGEIIAAQNFAVYKRAALYWTGAASAPGLDSGANSLLQWHAMQWMCQSGLEWYETGEAFPAATQGKLKGLNDFKKGFGGKLYPYHRGFLPLGSLAARLFRCYSECRSSLR